MPRCPAPHALLLAITLTACSRNSAAGADTETVECNHLRCDNPNPSNCACPDDTDGIITNTPTESLPDPETTGSSTTDSAATTSSSSGSSSTGTESTTTSSTGTGTSESSTGTESGSDGTSGTSTGTESGSTGATA